MFYLNVSLRQLCFSVYVCKNEIEVVYNLKKLAWPYHDSAFLYPSSKGRICCFIIKFHVVKELLGYWIIENFSSSCLC